MVFYQRVSNELRLQRVWRIYLEFILSHRLSDVCSTLNNWEALAHQLVFVLGMGSPTRSEKIECTIEVVLVHITHHWRTLVSNLLVRPQHNEEESERWI